MTRVIENLEHAEIIMRETKDAEWSGTIKHSEPQVLVAAAYICDHFVSLVADLKLAVDRLESEVAELREAVR